MSLTVLSISDLRNMVDEGGKILWTGLLSPDWISVHIRVGEKTLKYHMSTVPLSMHNASVICRKLEAESPSMDHGVVWAKSRWQRDIRLASINGMVRGGNARVGIGSAYSPPNLEHSAGYDIKTLSPREGGFPLNDAEIICASIMCSCGYLKSWNSYDWQNTMRSDCDCDRQYLSGLSSAEIADSLLESVISHKTDWLVGYNCYSFDNCCLCYHGSIEYKKYFQYLSGGMKKRSASYMMIIAAEGVYNVDIYSYLDKAHNRSRYSSLSLCVVVSTHGLSKLKRPSFHGDACKEDMVIYNIYDLYLASEVWIRSASMEEVCNLSCASKVPIVDCI